MRKVAITLLGLLLMHAATVASGAEIKLSDLEGTPKVYCRAVKEPNPALLGHFGGVHRSVNERSGEVVMEPVEYWLVKLGDQYALHFYRVKDGRGKTYKG